MRNKIGVIKNILKKLNDKQKINFEMQYDNAILRYELKFFDNIKFKCIHYFKDIDNQNLNYKDVIFMIFENNDFVGAGCSKLSELINEINRYILEK